MSSTSRAMRGESRDFYATPEPVTRAIIPYLTSLLGDRHSVRVLEPAAGDGAICRVVGSAFNTTCEAIDVCPQWQHEDAIGYDSASPLEPWRRDFLALPADPSFDLVITNPPFSLAYAFVQHSLEWLRPGGVSAMLLRVGFLEGIERHEWLREHVPDIAILPHRPSFDAPHPTKCTEGQSHAWLKANDARHFLEHVDTDGFELDGRWRCTRCGVRKKGSDSATYAWMIWSKRPRSFGRSFILPYD